MPADWLDDAVTAVGEALEDLDLLRSVTLHHRLGGEDQVTGRPLTSKRDLNVLRSGASGVKVVYERVESASRIVLRIFDPTVVVEEDDWFTWGTSDVEHVVKSVDGLYRDNDNTRYGAVCILE